MKNEETVSTDGRHFRVVANVGTPADLTDYQQSGAEGIGLLRSEFLYVDAPQLPTEDEQLHAYKKFLTSVHEQKVVVRTMDIGGDKQLGGLPLSHEDNP
ncbi:putative PEP-binding protein, partial [Bartonella sp. CL63NXGY]|uniref:putative PEP-binding protein n=1 Tax=Bartonella sp. CL63NXGY TaxID=3243538 RepID=UPI0035D10C05